MTNDIKFGDWVICDAYVIKSGKSISVADKEFPMIVDSVTGTATEIEAKDFFAVEIYHTKENGFCGIYIGTTIQPTRIVAEYYDDTYTSGWRVSIDTQQTFAVVYDDSEKRLVPLDKIRKQEVKK